MSSVPVQLPYNNHPGTKLEDNLDWEERADLLYHFYAYQEFARPNTSTAIDLVGLTDADVQYFNRVSYRKFIQFSPYSLQSISPMCSFGGILIFITSLLHAFLLLHATILTFSSRLFLHIYFMHIFSFLLRINSPQIQCSPFRALIFRSAQPSYPPQKFSQFVWNSEY
jgi:hypothetical protein